MSHQQVLATQPPTLWPISDPQLPLRTYNQRAALKQLITAFDARQPMSVLVCEHKCSARFLIERLVAQLSDDTDIIRLTGPHSDEMSTMRKVIHAIGFETKDLSFTDLENVFTMYLGFQQAHHRRTIVSLEDADQCGRWLADRLTCLLELEADNQFGLSLLVAGSPDFDDILNDTCSRTIASAARHIIALAPFALADTRDFIKARIEVSGNYDIAKVFEFDAITQIHNLSDGVVEVINSLYTASLELARASSIAPVTADLVAQAAAASQPQPPVQPANPEVAVLSKLEQGPPKRRVIVRMNNEIIKQILLDSGHILIGRDKLCNIRISNPAVSRHHLLAVNTLSGVSIIDLASTNGTFVDGTSIKHHDLADNGEILIGDYIIRFSTDDDRLDWYLDIERPVATPVHDEHAETQTLDCEIKGNINSRGEKIYHTVGMVAYSVTQIDESKGERWFRTEAEAIAAGWRPAKR